MEVSVQSKFKSDKILAKRREMLEKEKLHIKEKISYDTFLDLYNKYGEGLDDVEFAYAFLDVDDVAFKNLRSGKNAEMIILSREYISDKELWQIRIKVIENYGLRDKSMINKKQLMEIYDGVAGRISFRMLAEEILGMPVERARKLRKGAVQDTIISFNNTPGEYCISHKKEKDVPDYYETGYIKELREKVIREENLHIEETISYDRLIEIHQKYCPEMPETAFAQEILDLRVSAQNNMKGKRKLDQAILGNIEITDEYIKTLQNKIILLYKLQPGEVEKYKVMQYIYQKEGHLFTERGFITLFLEVADEYYNSMKNERSEGAVILKNRTINYENLRRRIIRENNLHYDDMIQYPEFHELHQRYAPKMPEKTFAQCMLDINHTMLQHIKYNEGRARILLEEKLPTKEELKKLQHEVIIRENLHLEDKINHKQLIKLHEQYGGILSVEMFALEVLAMDKQGFDRIKNPLDKDGNENTKNALILTKFKISEAAIEELKEKIMREHNLEEPRKVSLEEIEMLYNLYGGIMGFIRFHRDVLGVSTSTISNMRNEKQDGTIIEMRRKMTEDEVKLLKIYLAQDLTKTEIAKRMNIRISFLEASMKSLKRELTVSELLYEKVKILKEQKKSVDEIADTLGISKEDTKDMLSRYRVEKKEEEEKEKASKREEKRKKKEEEQLNKLHQRVVKIIDDYKYNDKNVQTVKKYIKLCEERFTKADDKRKVFADKDLLFLAGCMEFIVCNFTEIVSFAKMCIGMNRYHLANTFISENIDNPTIYKQEREMLRNLQREIYYAIRKEKALKHIENGVEDINEIAEMTGVMRRDILKLMDEQDTKKLFLGTSDKRSEEDGIAI